MLRRVQVNDLFMQNGNILDVNYYIFKKGVGAKFSDAEYESAGAKIVNTNEVFQSDILIVHLVRKRRGVDVTILSLLFNSFLIYDLEICGLPSPPFIRIEGELHPHQPLKQSSARGLFIFLFSFPSLINAWY
jgi:hypothetical protein